MSLLKLGVFGFVLDWTVVAGHLLNTLIFVVIGLVFFTISLWVMDKMLPFSVHKEIEEDQNTALGIIIGAMLIGIAIIIAAASHG